MKFVVVLSAVLALAFAENYKSNIDNLDIEAVVTNPEKLKGVTQCFLDNGECSDVIGAIKKVLPEATEQACAKCTDPQKHMLKRYLTELSKTYPEDFEALKKKYDPENKYVDALRAALANA
uniref:Chemosensory protein n=1 Tax=Leucinodes orbonalis TaxID=711050 RepID=A0AAU0QJR0_9NEOP|nr:chemosensory protein [Leucinodes orbonalis]